MLKIFENFEVKKIPSKSGKEFIIKNHYSRGCHNGPMCWGLFRDETLVGVCAFATPSSENVRASVFGVEFKNSVTELHRLVLLDDVEKNAESWFIVRALRGLKEYKPHIKAVLSFADSTEGHIGTIYQATNALFCGTTGNATFFRDQDGRLRHPRQNGINITVTEAKKRGWIPETRQGKFRYLFLLPDGKIDRKVLFSNLKLKSLPYPKKQEDDNGPER